MHCDAAADRELFSGALISRELLCVPLFGLEPFGTAPLSNVALGKVLLSRGLMDPRLIRGVCNELFTSYEPMEINLKNLVMRNFCHLLHSVFPLTKI